MASCLGVIHLCKNTVAMKFYYLIFFIFCYFTANISAQQGYSANSVLNCNYTEYPNLSPTVLYTCNGKESSCRTFVIFISQFPYDSVVTISRLTASDILELALVNNVSRVAVFPTGKEVIVPVNCSCSGQYYQANTSYTIPDTGGTYLTIANNTYGGLSTCDALLNQNVYSEHGLEPGLELQVPLRCACPSSNQISMGTKYLLTYSIFWGDSISAIRERFNVSRKNLLDANGFSEDNPTIFPFTTILVPIPVEPTSSQTVIHVPLFVPPPYTPIRRKTKPNKRLYLGVGVSVGSLVAIFLILVFVFLCHWNKLGVIKRKNPWALPENLVAGIATVDRVLKVFAFKDLKIATNGFESVSIIKGSVYRGVLDGEIVAIKKVNNNIKEKIKVLNKINHFNLIRLYGVCEDDGYSYLVYEYMENGCLKNLLRNKNYPLVQIWSQRVQIALDVANAIHYLHNFTKPSYVHKDIKSSNILLDGNLRAKVANFGLATSTERRVEGLDSSKLKGTRGYMAPEYLETGFVTPKMDVYAFGVVLMELVTGKNVLIMGEAKELLLSDIIISIMEGENMEAELYKIIDPSFNVNYRMDIALSMAKLSVACLKRDLESRLSMEEVVSTLVRIQRDCENL